MIFDLQGIVRSDVLYLEFKSQYTFQTLRLFFQIYLTRFQQYGLHL
jgi:hypothetical protein